MDGKAMFNDFYTLINKYIKCNIYIENMKIYLNNYNKNVK